MNNFEHFKFKMLIILTFCFFMTFSMLIYVMIMTGKCENSANEMCIDIKKGRGEPTYGFYNSSNTTIINNNANITTSKTQILKPLFSTSAQSIQLTTKSVDLKSNSVKRMERASIFRLFNVSLPFTNTRKEQSVTKTDASIETLKIKEAAYDSVNSNRFDGADKKFQWKLSNSSNEIYVKRRDNLQRLCPKYLDLNDLLKSKKIALDHILIDEKHKVLYCYVPKVACTNWKRIFLLLTGKVDNISEVISLRASEVHAKNLFKSLQNYTIEQVQNVTKEYTKFIFVRNPFERLLSAYRNKLEQHYDSSKYFQARFGKYIIKNFRKNPTNVSLERGDDVTFREFVNYIVSSDPMFYNEHWQRVTDLCHPCLIKYDFIGKYDTLIQDSNFLLNYFGTNFSFPMLPKPSTTALNLKKYYNSITTSDINKLYKIYEMDFRLFGYDFFNSSDWLNNF